MHKKRHLEERLAACGDLLLVRGRPMPNLKTAAEEYRALLPLDALFPGRSSYELEIGCGNGKFVAELAKRENGVGFLAVEISSNVILTAMERVKAEGIPNVRFLNIPAEILPCYLPERSVGTIYLNFSTPLPETSRERQRLTSSRFLQIYRTLLKEGGKIVQKTDSEEFFDYSIARFKENGFLVTELTRDLHSSPYAQENIVTEYERSFADKGKKIFRCVAVLGSSIPQGG